MLVSNPAASARLCQSGDAFRAANRAWEMRQWEIVDIIRSYETIAD
jgi:hypothetical protein